MGYRGAQRNGINITQSGQALGAPSQAWSRGLGPPVPSWLRLEAAAVVAWVSSSQDGLSLLGL